MLLFDINVCEHTVCGWIFSLRCEGYLHINSYQ